MAKRRKGKALTGKALAKKQHSVAVVLSRRATQARRARLAADFRAALLRELGPGELSASRMALVESACSAYTQMCELSSRFISTHATQAAVRHSAIARGQMQRALRALGLVDRDKDDDAQPQTVEEILAEAQVNV